MDATITQEQRDALDALLIDRLDGLDGIETAFKAGNLAYAESLARQYADELQVLAALRAMEAQAELRAKPDALRQVMERLRAIAEGHTSHLAPQLAELREDTKKNRLVAEACTAVLLAIAEATAEAEEKVSGMKMTTVEEVIPRSI